MIDIYKEDREKAEDLQYIKVLRVTFGEKFCVKIWRPKAIKPYCFYSFPTEEKRQLFIDNQLRLAKEHKESVISYRQSKQITSDDAQQIKKGDIFVTSWGYDQTNYDYIVVLSVSSTGKTAECQRTSSLHMGNCGKSNVQEPIFCPFGDKFTMRLEKGYKGGICLRGSYPFCHDGTGSKRLDTFSRHSVGSQYHETMAEFGH